MQQSSYEGTADTVRNGQGQRSWLQETHDNILVFDQLKQQITYKQIEASNGQLLA